MIRYHLSMVIIMVGWVNTLQAADRILAPQIRSATVSAVANQSFGGASEKAEKASVPDFASFPQMIQARTSDQMGDERRAKADIRLEMETGLLRFKGRLEASDSNPNDFLAPIASIKGAVTLDLKVLLSDKSETAKVSLRAAGEGPPALIGTQEGKPLPANIMLQVWLNEELILDSTQVLLGVEKSVPAALRHGDMLTVTFQSDFSIFSTGQADVVSTLFYKPDISTLP